MRSLIILILYCCLFLGTENVKYKQSIVARRERYRKMRRESSENDFIFDLIDLVQISQIDSVDLLDSLNEIHEELQQKQEKKQLEYQQRLSENRNQIQYLRNLIYELQASTSSQQDYLFNVLVPQENQISQEIRNIQKELAQIQESIRKGSLLREQQSNLTSQKLSDSEFLLRSISEIQETISIIAGSNYKSSQNGSMERGEFIQLKKITKNVDALGAKLREMKQFQIESAILKNLIDIKEVERFSNSEIQSKIRGILEEIRDKTIQQINQTKRDEEQQEQQYQDVKKQMESRIIELEQRQEESEKNLESSRFQSKEIQKFLDEREIDHSNYQIEVDEETRRFEEFQSIYEQVSEEIQKEISVCQDILELIVGQDYSFLQFFM